MTDTPKIDMTKVIAIARIVGSFLAVWSVWFLKHLKKYFAATLYRNMEEPGWFIGAAMIGAVGTMILAGMSAYTPSLGRCIANVCVITAISVLFGSYIVSFFQLLFEYIGDGIDNLKEWAADNRHDDND